MPDSDSSDPGSTPGIPTKRIALSSNRLGRHPFTVKTYGFEPRRRDQLGHSAAASTPDFDSGGPGSSPGTPTQWSFGRRGVCVGLKIRRTWFNSARLRRHGENSSVGQSIGLWIQRSRVRAPLLTPREYSSVVEQMAVNHRVVGSSPSFPAMAYALGHGVKVTSRSPKPQLGVRFSLPQQILIARVAKW